MPSNYYIRCAKCSKKLTNSDGVLEKHEEATKKQIACGFINKAGEYALNKDRCDLIFLNEEVFYELCGADAVQGSVQGSIYCPHCKGKIGRFDWSGNNCSCGAVVTPALSLIKSRVDVVGGAAALDVADRFAKVAG